MSSSNGPILPGATIGVLGSGQLGRMFAIAARRMGYRVHTLSPDTDTPTGQVADQEFQAAYDNLDEVRRFARGVRAVTFEFENVPSATVAACAEFAPVRPRGEVLHVTQHRRREKTYLAEHGFPVAPFRAVRSREDFDAAIAALGLPSVLKTAGFGYDGKGQALLRTRDDAEAAWAKVGEQELVLEGFIDFACELSVVAARGVDGSQTNWGVMENLHAHHILDLTISPARVPEAVTKQATEIARAVLETLDVVGVLCVEFFLAKSGQLIINELAPRPHNSGHLTFDACMTSQFEQQLRAVCGLPLGATTQLRPSAMANLLGDVWYAQDGTRREPNWAAACRIPEVKLHLYGKSDPRPGRKMGHLTALADNVPAAIECVRAARAALTR